MKADILRILDVNCNRAREAFRVIEDYARFSLNDGGLSESLKKLRHDFQLATAGMQKIAVLYRDTPGDVGTTISTATERSRADLSAVIVASCKRLGEALRTIEEYGKVGVDEGVDFQGSMSVQIESLRYRFYEIEKRVMMSLGSDRERMSGVRLYVLMTQSLCRKAWQIVAREAIAGGADCLQLREKEMESGALLEYAKEFVQVCHESGAMAIINDRVDIALLSGADGVHVGQRDISCSDARKMMGMDRIVGVSTHRIEQARQAVVDGADYIGIGPIFPSLTKPNPNLAGLPYAQEVMQELSIKAIAISGIDRQNLSQLIELGITSIAVSSSVIGSDDPRQAAHNLKQMLVAHEIK